MRPEIRKDYFLDKYVVIAPKRGRKQHEIERPEVLNPQAKATNAFHPSEVNKKHALLTLGPKQNWYVKVIKDDAPAMTVDNPKAYGQQEIVIETPNPIAEIEDLSLEHIAKIFEAYSHRTRELMKNGKIEYISTFKQSGGKARAVLQHAYSQIVATSFLPPLLFEKSRKARAYHQEHGHTIWSDIIKQESKSRRLIWKDSSMIAFAPYASFHNYEVWIMPLKRRERITDLTKQERMSMARMLKHLLKKIGMLHLPYNYSFDQVTHDQDQYFTLRLTPRGSVWANEDTGTHLVFNSISPEEAAAFYRNGLKK